MKSFTPTTIFSFKRLSSDLIIRIAIMAGVAILFALILYPSLIITEQNYIIGDVAERDIKAPKDFFIEDKEVTESHRRRAIEEVLTIYDHNTALVHQLNEQVRQAFNSMRAVYESESGNPDSDETALPAAVSSESQTAKIPLHDQVWQMKERFEELLGIKVSDGAYRLLENEEFSLEISNLIVRIMIRILSNGVVANKEFLLREADKGIVLRDVENKTEKVVHNLKQFYGLDQAKTMVRVVGQPILEDQKYTIRNLIVDFAQRLIQPNITLNRSATEELKKKAAAEVKPVLYKMKAGEMVLREGERVTATQLLKLNALKAQIRDEKILVSSAGAALLLLCLLVSIYLLFHERIASSTDLNQNKNILFIGIVIVATFLMSKATPTLSSSLTQSTSFFVSAPSVYFAIPIASAAMMVCLFLGLEIALPVALIVAVSNSIIFQNRLELFVYFLISGAMGAYWIRNCRERKVFIKCSLKLGFLNVLLVAAIDIYFSELSGVKPVWDWVFAFIGGIGAGIITAGIAPMVEVAFGYTTDIKLLELANLDQPILRRLMIEAPGTYHHSVIVGTMVEAAAAEIGANPLLAKVCGYYHDIGKIKQPLYFIENQSDGKNKHDKLAPSMSSLILIAHVKNGVEIAKENKLGQSIIDTIQQHHGSSLISFFYEKAKQLRGEDKVTIDDYRYPGPKPQTREAGLVMLADVVEAASRTLDNPTPSRIQGLVQNLINKIFSDGQLDNCELTLKDLHKIAKSFNTIMNGIHHHRIEYIEKRTANNGKTRNGSADRQSPKQVPDISQEDSKNGTGRLKRLGLS